MAMDECNFVVGVIKTKHANSWRGCAQNVSDNERLCQKKNAHSIHIVVWSESTAYIIFFFARRQSEQNGARTTVNTVSSCNRYTQYLLIRCHCGCFGCFECREYRKKWIWIWNDGTFSNIEHFMKRGIDIQYEYLSFIRSKQTLAPRMKSSLPWNSSHNFA